MRQALDIALKDLRRTYRDVPALAMMLAAPLAIALLLGAAFGGSGDFSIRPIKTIVADLDAGAATGAAGETGAAGAAGAGPTLAQLLGDESLTSLIDLTIVSTEAEARAAVDDGTAAVAVVQPEGLTAAAAAHEFADRTAAEGSRPTVQARAPRVSGVETTRDVGVTGPVLAGMMIFFMLLTGSNQARTILDEQRAGTLQRLFTTPTARGVVLWPVSSSRCS